MNDNFLRISGSDLVAAVALLNSNNAGISGLGTGVKFSIFRMSDSMYWDNGTGDFDSASEVLNDASEVGTTGLYEYALTGANDTNIQSAYRVRMQATQTSTGDLGDFVSIDELISPSNVRLISDVKDPADRLSDAAQVTIFARVQAVPTSATELRIKELTNDAAADLNQANLLANGVVYFKTGALKGQRVRITAQQASASDPIILTTTPMVNFGAAAINDEVVIT